MLASSATPAAAAAAAGGFASASQSAANRGANDWDPDCYKHAAPPTKGCLSRIRSDLKSLMKDPLHGIVAIPDAKDSTKVDALIVGPEDTPYAGGLFVFRVAFPADYPAQAPKVKLLTTGGGTVRFNPNLYMNGKVCLSILGTWSGPGWSSSQSLASVLLSIQSLLNAHPAHNEPGFSATSSKIEAYDAVIAHETLRVAVLGALQDPASALPAQLVDAALEMACSNASVFAKTAKKWAHMDGKQFADPFANNVGGQNKGVFNFTGLSADIADRCAQLHGSASDSEHSDTSSGSDSDDDTTGQP